MFSIALFSGLSLAKLQWDEAMLILFSSTFTVKVPMYVYVGRYKYKVNPFNRNQLLQRDLRFHLQQIWLTSRLSAARVFFSPIFSVMIFLALFSVFLYFSISRSFAFLTSARVAFSEAVLENRKLRDMSYSRTSVLYHYYYYSGHSVYSTKLVIAAAIKTLVALVQETSSGINVEFNES